MMALNYKRLEHITNTTSPYRGTLNRFPIGNRRHNNKYFLVVEEDGKRVFKIVYGQNWNSVNLTKQQFDELENEGAPRLHKYQEGDGTWNYYHYETKPNVLGVVRPDNTFEFTGGRYGQGERGILSSWTTGHFATDSRRGGMIWRGSSYTSSTVLPIHHGMRVNCETLQPTKPITVIGRKVDRKVGKELLAKYEDFYRTTEVMTKAMNYEMFVKTMAEVALEHMPEGAEGAWHWQKCKDKADSLIETAPLDSAMLYMLGWDIGSMRWNLRRFMDTQFGRFSANEDEPYQMFLNLKRRLNKEIYKANDSVFKQIEYTNGEVYPPSEWGYKIMVDGQEVQQYD